MEKGLFALVDGLFVLLKGVSLWHADDADAHDKI
jgi:hypothetical protein